MLSEKSVKGEIACSMFDARALEKGLVVSRPIVECVYDRLLDDAGKFIRVQIKYAGATSSNSNGVVVANLVRTDSQSKKQISYTQDEIDVVVVYVPQVNKLVWLPRDVWSNRKSVSIRYLPSKNNQTKGCMLIDDYQW